SRNDRSRRARSQTCDCSRPIWVRVRAQNRWAWVGGRPAGRGGARDEAPVPGGPGREPRADWRRRLQCPWVVVGWWLVGRPGRRLRSRGESDLAVGVAREERR